MEHSTSSLSSLDKGKREPEMEDSASDGSSSLDKGKREPEMEDSQSGPSSSYKGKRKEEIEDESDLSEQDKAVAAIMAKMKDERAEEDQRTEEDQRIKDQLLADTINNKLTHLLLEDQSTRGASVDLRNTEHTFASVERPCIYVVHEKFSRTSNYAYTPETVSIGPVHRDKKNLQATEDIKERYMNTLLLRTGNRLEKLQCCVTSIRKLIESARQCYSEQIRCDDTTFTIMMIVDGLFIIELLLRYSSLVPVGPDDPIFNNHLLLLSIVRDLILLENQIPMVVLDELFKITCSGLLSNGETLEQLAIGLFVNWIPTTELGSKTLLAVGTYTQSKHLLDLVRNSLQFSFGDTKINIFSHRNLCINSLQLMQVPCVTKLRKAGIKLRQRTDAQSIFDIKFRNGVLEIPRLLIGHQTDTLFRNVIACEQYCDGNHSQMTSYAFLMDGLINTPNDVEILRDKGIIQHSLGSDEYVSSLFNNLCCEVCLTEYKYDSLCHDLKVYYNKQWNKWFQDLREYFRTPWKATSIIVAALVLLSTAGAFVFAVVAFIFFEK